MARTRGGGVISGMAARPRRNVGKPPMMAGGNVGQSAYALLPASQENDIDSGMQAQPKTRAGRRTSERRAATPTVIPPSITSGRGRKVLRKEGQTFVGEANPPGRVTPPNAANGRSPPEADPIGLLEGVESSPRPLSRNRCKTSSAPPQRDSCLRARKLSSAPLKSEVWRMLYVDPDVADPKLVAGRLEVAASMVLRCGCVFDVATDIVQALADVREDTMPLYRAVFVNETLQRHKKSAQSIEGKHLAHFFRQAGMSAARIVLLVGGDLKIDTADAGAHGLSAVLKKPFTRDGFCDVLRGMYLNGDAAGEGGPKSEGSGKPAKAASQAKEPTTTSSASITPSSCAVPCKPMYPSLGTLPVASNLPMGMDCSPSSAAAAAMAAAAARAATVHSAAGVLGPAPPSFPECLGFTPFPPAMLEQLRRCPMVSNFSRTCGSALAGRRKYTKIAPREKDETAMTAPRKTPSESSTPEPPTETPTATADASSATGSGAEQNGSGSSPLSGGADSEMRSEGSGGACDQSPDLFESPEE